MLLCTIEFVTYIAAIVILVYYQQETHKYGCREFWYFCIEYQLQTLMLPFFMQNAQTLYWTGNWQLLIAEVKLMTHDKSLSTLYR